MNYKYSIVMPAYNIEKYISEMIESIIQQTYLNWELIIIDDGSEDKTGEICDKYVCDKIVVHHIENKGQIGARIEGIKKCTGDYTLVVDADDFLEKNCLQEVNNVLSQREYDCIVFPFKCCDEKFNYIYTTSAPIHIGELSQRELIRWIIDSMNHGLVNKVVKTDLIKKGIAETMTEKVSINGDLALIIPIVCYVKTTFYLNIPCYKYRMFNGSISHNRLYKHVIDTDHVTKSIVDILKRHQLFNDEIETAVMKSYLEMIVWLISEVNNTRFIKKNEIEELHKSDFFRESETYESKELIGREKVVELKFIRNERKGALLCMNIFLKVDNAFKFIIYGMAKILKKVICKVKKERSCMVDNGHVHDSY